jgi:1-acyl-sn-glycerol-3-phosphate acyltransferase
MYVEGGRSRNGSVGTEAKAGIGRLALESGAAVVPVAILGSHQVRNWKRLRFAKVVVRYGKPFRFTKIANPTHEQQQYAADQILRRIRALHAELDQAGRKRAAAAARASVIAERSP